MQNCNIDGSHDRQRLLDWPLGFKKSLYCSNYRSVTIPPSILRRNRAPIGNTLFKQHYHMSYKTYQLTDRCDNLSNFKTDCFIDSLVIPDLGLEWIINQNKKRQTIASHENLNVYDGNITSCH